MYISSIPKFAGPNAQQAAQRWAKIEVKLRFLNTLEQAADYLLIQTHDTASEEFYLLQQSFVESSVNYVRQRQQEKRSKVTLLTKIEGIDHTLGKRLINEFGTLEVLSQAPMEQLQMVEGINEELAKAVKQEVPNLIKAIKQKNGDS